MQKTMICSFCGRSQPEVKKFIASPTGNAYICDECIEICNQIMQNDKRPVFSQKLLSPSQIKKHLDDYIIGQEHAKIVLSVAVYNHYKKIQYNQNTKNTDKIMLEKSNILLVGPTGCGKTLLAKTLAKILQVPFASCDATTITETGYVGDDVESVLTKLLSNANGDVKKAQKGIIYIDEIDKIAKKSENRNLPKDPAGEGVQQALLKIIEGKIATVPVETARKTPYQETVSMDTSDILFICGGAFVGLEKIMKERTKNHSVGFEKKYNKTDFTTEVLPQDLNKFGLIPEFVGRLPIVTQLEKLTENDLCDILTKPKNSIIKQYSEMLKMDDVGFCVTEDAIRQISKRASKLEDGARGLRTILENSMLDAMYKLPNSDIKKVTLSVDGEKLYCDLDEQKISRQIQQ